MSKIAVSKVSLGHHLTAHKTYEVTGERNGIFGDAPYIQYRLVQDNSVLGWVHETHLDIVEGKPSKRIYVIGSLRNQNIPKVAATLRAAGYEVFDDWYAAGPEADDYWKEYEQERGRSYIEALSGAAAKNVYEFDKRNLDASDAALLVLPAGKSGHLELGYMAGKGKKTFILVEDNTDRWDVMYQFATAVVHEDTMLEEIASVLK